MLFPERPGCKLLFETVRLAICMGHAPLPERSIFYTPYSSWLRLLQLFRLKLQWSPLFRRCCYQIRDGALLGPARLSATIAGTNGCLPNHTVCVSFVLAVLKAKIKIKNHRIRAGIGPKPKISLGKWQSGPSPGTPRAKDKIKNLVKHSQVVCACTRRAPHVFRRLC